MRYEASHDVFVAMPFTKPFQRAYETVIERAIVAVSVGGKRLNARIINRATSGAPDIHERIFDAIIHSRLVIADMTVQASCVGDAGAARWQANANVAYEVGLASAWRNPEDILLIHQAHRDHSYSFDIQNLRHVEYDPADARCVAGLAEEIVRALNQSTFLARRIYQKILESVSPSAIQFMHQESRRAFPVIAFRDGGMPIMDSRIHAATELLGCGALANRNVIGPRGENKGATVIYRWTELGLRLLLSIRAIDQERRTELAAQIASVPDDGMPPRELMEFPEPEIAPHAAEADSAPAVDREHEDAADSVRDEPTT
jgi:hypothetical protein